MPLGVTKIDHYNSFGKLISELKPVQIDASIDVLPIFSLCEDWKKSDKAVPLTGSFIGGKLGGVAVMFSPDLDNKVRAVLKDDAGIVDYDIVYEEIQYNGRD